MVIDFQAHVFPASYIGEMKRQDGAVILEPPDPHSGMSYFYDKRLKCRINTATFQGQDIDRRIDHIYTGRTEEIRERYGLKENPLDSYRRFYVDTADHPAATLRCVKNFFGPDRMVLGTNYPYGPEEGCVFVKNSLKAIDGLELNAADKEKILGGNAARVLGMGAA